MTNLNQTYKAQSAFSKKDHEQNMTPAHMPPTEDAEEELDTVDIGKEAS